MKTNNKRLIVGISSIAVLDLVGLVTMIVNPDLTERVIPALFGVQILGFVAIAFIVMMGRREYIVTKEDKEANGTGKQWVPWLFGFLTLLSFLRVVLALLRIAGEEGHRHSWFSPISGTLMGCFFLWIAFKARSSASNGIPKKKATGPDNSPTY